MSEAIVKRPLEPGPVNAPLLSAKHYAAPSVFKPESLLREARRQKQLEAGSVPHVCVLDPDGDIARRTKAAGRASRDSDWACYHTDLFRLTHDGLEIGIVPCAVGASFAVLVAEQLFASGCRLLVSMTSSGQLTQLRPPPYFVMIERALRDEGTSYHYLPPSRVQHRCPLVLLRGDGWRVRWAFLLPVHRGATWTTDAPFRETAAAIAADDMPRGPTGC